MLGHAAIAETALADVGGVLQVATAEMSGISSASSVGVGELVGVASMSAAFSQQTEVGTKSKWCYMQILVLFFLLQQKT